MKLIANMLLIVMGYSPIFGITDDDNFIKATITSNKKRISLINLHLGATQFQVLSVSLIKPYKINLFRLAKLKDIERFNLDEKKTTELKSNFERHLDSLRGEEILIEREALGRHFEINWNRNIGSISKVDILSSITLVIIPFILFQSNVIDKIDVRSINFSSIILLLLIYAVANLAFWVFQAVHIKTIKMSTFHDLKCAKDKEKELCWQMYFDWQSVKRISDLSVSYVSYILESYKIISVLTVVLLTTLFLKDFASISSNDNTDNKMYLIKVDDLNDVYSDSYIIWNEMECTLINNQPEEIIVIGNDADVDKLEMHLQKYLASEITLYRDSTTKENEPVRILIKE